MAGEATCLQLYDELGMYQSTVKIMCHRAHYAHPKNQKGDASINLNSRGPRSQWQEEEAGDKRGGGLGGQEAVARG